MRAADRAVDDRIPDPNGSMKLERVTLRGFMGFVEPVTLDLSAIGPGLVALVGENGSGKTTILEGALAALYRRFPSRGELAPYAIDRDSFVEAAWLVGEQDDQIRYLARVNVDGVRRVSDAILLEQRPGESRRLNDGKASTFDAAVAEIFPSLDLVLASAFAAQNHAGDFITQKPAQRRELFGELLGLERLLGMGRTAKAIAVLFSSAHDRQRATRDVLAQQTDDVDLGLDAQAAQLTQGRDQAQAEQTGIAARLALLEAELAALGDQAAAFGAATRRRLELAADRARVAGRLGQALADLDQRLASNTQIQAEASVIRGAAALVARLDGELEGLDGELTQARQAAAEARRGLWAVENQIAALGPVKAAQTRAERDVAILGSVPCHGQAAYAGCRFLTEAQAAQGELAALAARLAPLEALVADVGNRRRLEVEAERTVARLEQAVGAAASVRAGQVARARLLDKLEASDERLVELRATRAQVEAQAAADLAELDAALGAVDRELAELRDGNAATIATQGKIREARAEWDRTTATIAATTGALEGLEIRRNELRAKRRELARVEQTLAALAGELLEWETLERALSKDGLPELEIDAAGPTIAAYTNELLEVAHESRFSLELVTQVARADGKGVRDEFTIRVTDNVAGGVARDIADLSGGEQVIVSEALRCAISIYVNRRSPAPLRTCWRDETTGALDPDNAARYLAMLRKLQQLGGYENVVFITHNVDAAALADAQVRVADGRVEILRSPYAAVA